MPKTFEIAVFNGDGIGPEIMAPTLTLLSGLSSDYDFVWHDCPAGAASYLDCGSDLPEASLDTARRADAILLSALGDPAVRFPDGTEMTPQIDIRIALDLYAGVRPVRVVPGMRTPLALPEGRTIDFVLIRESTEGLFHTQGKGTVTDDMAEETLRITRATTEKVCRFTFDLAEARRAGGHPGRVTSVDKANVFRAFAFWREIFDGIAKDHPELTADHAYVDAMALYMVQKPWDWDVMVTENMFGDILSDLGAGLMGGLGMAPSADIGDDHALFQPCHGSAPDIAGQGIANPFAMILSAGMMLDWLGRRQGIPAMVADAARVQAAVDACLAAGETTGDLGGTLDTQGAAHAVIARL
ncbi:3-isopropylmalate dehydrogenase [Jannaschia pagri]|uniref:3-isopropylmalate dehydrogenase n=1 Tax=Jannaschia pagri TaxID=2829797 RepID=A0ABQ4NGF5_9RHOB|nr:MULTISPECIES: isocitrate/isopropylmalate family dehydrogenase [unclassified Jannaschia]GIT90392.1 3-isopropylmalate dehydrogenase [Jannaschia sp. AI_61]GIT93503.1 3-isopropylmalate dehydrogenase [Jannaschia sp. AI_62]